MIIVTTDIKDSYSLDDSPHFSCNAPLIALDVQCLERYRGAQIVDFDKYVITVELALFF